MDVDSLTRDDQPGEIGRHARDYTRVMALLKWGAIIAFVLAILIMIIIA